MPYRISEQVVAWVNRGDKAIADLLPLHAGMNGLPAQPRYKRALMSLSTACLGSTGTVLHLTEVMRLWDAERIMRAVVEGTVKFAYMLESPDTFIVRCTEYCDALPAIGSIRRHMRAQECLNAAKGANDQQEQPLRDLLLGDAELQEIRAAFPRGMRADIERRWGFTALVDAVSAQGGAIGPTARALLHGYSIASELQHMSQIGAELPLERDTRSADRREAIERAHAAKLIGDSYHFAFLRVIVILRFLKQAFDPLREIEARHAPLMEELHEAERKWADLEYGQCSALERQAGDNGGSSGGQKGC